MAEIDEHDFCDDADYDEDDMIDIGAEFEAATSYGPSSSSSAVAACSSASEVFDPEYLDYRCLDLCDVERLLNEAVQKLCTEIPVTPSLAKVLLHHHQWSVPTLVRRYKANCHLLLVDTHLKPTRPVAAKQSRCTVCPVCARANLSLSELTGLACSHSFCRACWLQHCSVQLGNGISTGIECMEAECRLLAPEDFILNLLSSRTDLRSKYQTFVFRDHVKSHPELRICPGTDCRTVIQGTASIGKRVTCNTCKTSFCVQCSCDYHAPTSCDNMRQWMIKCADDSETGNYISAHTKDCPQCHACIEKNGGCNHMQCAKCKHHFCWMCLGDWRSHGSEYYECSRYKENPNVASETTHVKARRALEKYLHYFERWENHAKSLMLEKQLTQKIKTRIENKVNRHEGTWIDWQYLHNAAQLLTQCRYTLQYTYPFAFYLPSGSTKDLFEYQQAQLEKEIEDLSWKVERAESTDRGDLEAQMHGARQKRLTLLKDFFETGPSHLASIDHL